jgi:small subunit ribosomal protein S30e
MRQLLPGGASFLSNFEIGPTYILGLIVDITMPTHGSLTKAGKVRGQTPKIKGMDRTSPIARVRNRINFVKRFEKRRFPGQRKPERTGRR